MSSSRQRNQREEKVADEAEILGKSTEEKPPKAQAEPDKPRRTPPPPQDQMRRRMGNLIKCPHCEVVLHVDKTYPDARTRRLHCLNEECPRLKEKKKRYARIVSIPVQNQEEDLGVMSARQRDHEARAEGKQN